MGKEFVFSVPEGIVFSPAMVGEISDYWERMEVGDFKPRDLLIALVRNHRDLFHNFTTEFELDEMLKDAEEQLPTRRSRQGEFTPWMEQIIGHAQVAAGENPIDAPHLLYGILAHENNEAYSLLDRASRPGKIAELKQSLYNQITSSQAA